ncbi:hypothetical protein FIC_02093 [Flavobacteriaceae bacterium 3519-10]|nr:hypothetical protein FIC_02093 [Flavobacteriaceae bacterium 3519-10]
MESCDSELHLKLKSESTTNLRNNEVVGNFGNINYRFIL